MSEQTGGPKRDAATSFLYSDPPLGGFPDVSLLISTGFEAAGSYENWDFVVYQKHDYAGGRWKLRKVAAGRTLEAAVDRAREKLRAELAADEGKAKCHVCGMNERAMDHVVDGERLPLCMKCFASGAVSGGRDG